MYVKIKVKGSLQSGCYTNLDCMDGLKCSDSKCVSELNSCTDSSECDNGQTCYNQICGNFTLAFIFSSNFKSLKWTKKLAILTIEFIK